MTRDSISNAPHVLVVGADNGSLGEAVMSEMMEGDWDFGAVTTAGISGSEQISLDLSNARRVGEVLANLRPDIIVCTAGINEPVGVNDSGLVSAMSRAFLVNVTLVMNLLAQFVISDVRPRRVGTIKRFVAISSNSARIPRRNSVAYCASKAALSMALRVAARELAATGEMAVWGYEPGLLAGTPMTQNTERDFPPGTVLHRMKGVPLEGIAVSELAERIVQDIATFSPALNGVLVPFDAGEQ